MPLHAVAFVCSENLICLYQRMRERGKLGLEPTLAEETTDRWSPLGDVLVAGQDQSV